MLQRESIVGHRIVDVVGDSSTSDESFNFTDFVYVFDNGLAIRMPHDDESEDLLSGVDVTANHQSLDWPKEKRRQLKRNLWAATVKDILVPRDPEERYPDTGVILLSTDWLIVQLSAAPHGIEPFVNIVNELENLESMVSVWDAKPSDELS